MGVDLNLFRKCVDIAKNFLLLRTTTFILEGTTVTQIAYDHMEQLYEEIPKLDRYFRLIIQKVYGNLSKRIIRNHSMTAKERCLLFIISYPNLSKWVPQYMIASYLGITKEFLSRIRNRLVIL